MTQQDQQKRSLRDKIDPVVFTASAVLILAVVVFTGSMPDVAEAAFQSVQGFLDDTFGWVYILVIVLVLVVSIYLVVSPYATIKLGPDDAEPDYSGLTWFVMLFAAGMGIGLVFWGVAEPVLAFQEPARTEPGSVAAAEDAMNFAFHHWGFSPWAVYAIIGLGLAFFGYRRGLPMKISTLLHPLLGDRVDGPVGQVIDVVAVVATMFGVATSLGLGATQVAGGLDYVFGVELGDGGLVGLIAVITAIATISVALGLDKGIKVLSQVNLVAAAVLAAAVMLLGPTLFLVYALVDNTGTYLQNIIDTMLFTGAYDGEQADAFLSEWTIFYWAWWISWSPFVGMFIARVSYGRTIREFVLGVLLAPALVSFLWFTIFGNSALVTEGVVEAVQDEDTALFVLLEGLAGDGALFTALAVLAILVIVIFFVTSSDSASFVIDMLTSGGDTHPAVPTRVFWAVTEGAVAAVLLLAAGESGLEGLEAGAVSTGFPFGIIIVFVVWAILRGLRHEVRAQPRRTPSRGLPTTLPEAMRRDVAARQREFEEREQQLDELDEREEQLDDRDEQADDDASGASGASGA